MDVDFIKWMCEKAEGFGIGEDEIISPTGRTFTFNILSSIKAINRIFNYREIYLKEIYPLLLQRAIEGVNRERGRFDIESDYWKLLVCDNINKCSNKYTFDKYSSIDQAKESALKYIYNKEQNNA